MTDKQALTAARKLWGKNAMVRRLDKPTLSESGHMMAGTHSVGRVALGMFFEVLGNGMNWAEAIENANQRIARDNAEYAALEQVTK